MTRTEIVGSTLSAFEKTQFSDGVWTKENFASKLLSNESQNQQQQKKRYKNHSNQKQKAFYEKSWVDLFKTKF